MSDYFIYADEAGCFTFNRSPNVSKYFIIATIITKDWETPTLGLQRLRHQLISEGLDVATYFHATTDCQYDLIKSRITREYDLWSHGSKHYY